MNLIRASLYVRLCVFARICKSSCRRRGGLWLALPPTFTFTPNISAVRPRQQQLVLPDIEPDDTRAVLATRLIRYYLIFVSLQFPSVFIPKSQLAISQTEINVGVTCDVLSGELLVSRRPRVAVKRLHCKPEDRDAWTKVLRCKLLVHLCNR